MADYNYLDSTGVIVPDTSNVQAEVIEMFQTAFGTDLNTDPSTPQGVLISMFTTILTAMISNNAQLANQINPNLAGGVFLDAICSYTGLSRTPAASTTVLATVTGVPGTVIPTSAIAVTSAGAQFNPIDPITIPVGNTSTTGLFQATIPGPTAVPIGSLTIIQSGPVGWEAVNNSVAGTVGGGAESDAALRLLRQQTLAFNSTSISESIISSLLASKVCTSVGFQENLSASPQTINGVAMLANSVYVCATNNEPLTYTQVFINVRGIPGTEIGLTDNLPGSAITLSAALDTGTTYYVTATLAIPITGMVAGQTISITGAFNTTYNGTFLVSSVASDTSIVYLQTFGSAPSSDVGFLAFTDATTPPPLVGALQVSDGTNVFEALEPIIITTMELGGAWFQAIAPNATLNQAAASLTTIVTPIGGVTSATNTYPNTAYDNGFLESVATILLATKSAGAPWTTGVATAPFGPQNIYVVDPYSNQVYLVGFDTPTPIPIFIQVTVTTVSSFLFDQATNTFIADPVQATIDAILAYAAEYLGVGVNVSAFALGAAVSAANPGLQVSLVQISTGSSFATTPITIDIFQQAQITASQISVTTT